MSFLAELESLVTSQIEVVKTATSIFKLETRLAGLSVTPLLMTLCLLLIGLMATWSCAAIALGLALTLFISNTLLCIMIVLFLHLGIVLGLVKYLSFNLKNMSFEKTRHFLESHHVQSKKTAYPKHYADGAKVALPRKRSKSA